VGSLFHLLALRRSQPARTGTLKLCMLANARQHTYQLFNLF
jgi:hypothetical protein